MLTGEKEAPSRTWLHEHLECIRTSRAREKISDWFHARPRRENVEEAMRLIDRAFSRLGLSVPVASAVAAALSKLGYQSEDEGLVALGTGDCQIIDLLELLLPSTEGDDGGRAAPSQMSLIDDIPDAPSIMNPGYHIEMLAEDRSGLLMDITTFLGARGIMLLSNSGRVLPGTGDALITIEVQLDSLTELHALMDALEMIPAVRATKLINTQTSQGVIT